MKRLLFLAAALLLEFAISAQSTVTLTPSITAGDGQVVIPTMSWSTSPPLTTGTPCVAGATPALVAWTGPKAGSGTVTNIVITQNTRLTLSCTFPGDSIVTFTWTNPTQNTDGTPYSNPDIVRLKHTFGASLTNDPAIAASGETHSDSPQTPTPRTTMTVTGITQVGTLRAVAFARNANGAWSGPSSPPATKVFTGNVTVNQGVDITVRSIPNTITGLGAQ